MINNVLDVRYFDHNSSTKVHSAVLNNLLKYSMDSANASSMHMLGQKARSIVEDSREKFLKALNCSNDVKCIFTSSGTEANNLFIKSFSNESIITPSTEHVSILNTVKKLYYFTS